MRGIFSMISLLVVALIAGLVYKFYFAQSGTGSEVRTPTQTIDTIGVKSDLVAMGQAERIYQAQHSSYGSIDDLVSSGAMTLKKSGRDGYTYDVQFSTDSFRVTAACPAATSPGCQNYSIDQNMEVQTAP
jgi:hypothetical protein